MIIILTPPSSASVSASALPQISPPPQPTPLRTTLTPFYCNLEGCCGKVGKGFSSNFSWFCFVVTHTLFSFWANKKKTLLIIEWTFNMFRGVVWVFGFAPGRLCHRYILKKHRWKPTWKSLKIFSHHPPKALIQTIFLFMVYFIYFLFWLFMSFMNFQQKTEFLIRF